MEKTMGLNRISAPPLPGLGLVSDLCHSYPRKVISENSEEQKWLKISPNKSVN